MAQSSTKPNIHVILPLPEKSEYAQLSRVIPPQIFEGGIKNLAVLALENWNEYDDYVSDAFIWIEHQAFSREDDPTFLRHQRRLGRPAYQNALELLLHFFYQDFTALATPILGDYEPHLEKVVSMKPINGILVELSHGWKPRVAYCPAR